MTTLIVALLLFFLSSSAFAQTVTHGPLLENHGSQTTTMQVKYWLAASAEAALEVDGVGQFKQTGALLKFSLTGLAANTSYTYRLKRNDGTVADPGGTFKTFKAAGDVKICLVGDFGSGGGQQNAVAQQMLKSGCEIYVTLGDNVYDANYETNLQPGPVFTKWLDQPGYRALHRNVPVFVSYGNHDRPQVAAAIFDGGSRYAIRNGDMAMVVAFTYGGSVSSTNTEYRNWIDQKLTESADKTFKFFNGHYAPFHCDSGYTYDASMRVNWVPILEKHKVDYSFHGHHHNFVRFHARNGVRYLVNGMGSAGAQAAWKTCQAPYAARRNSGAGFTLVEIVNKVLTVKTIGYDGVVWDVDIIDKAPPPAPNQEPNGNIASPAGNISVTAGSTVNFQGVGSDPDNHVPISFEWQINGAIVGEEQNLAHVFPVAGVFQVTLIVRDAQELADSTPAQLTVTVQALPPPPSQQVEVKPQSIQTVIGQGPSNFFDLAKSKPRPSPWPKIATPSFAGSSAGRSWTQYVIEPIAYANSKLFTGVPMLCHQRNGTVTTRHQYYQHGNRAEDAAPFAESWPIHGGPRNVGLVSPYSTLVSDPSYGFWGVGLAGDVWLLHNTGRIEWAHGPQTVVEDGKVYCGERKYIGKADKPLKMPIDLKLWRDNGVKNRNRILIADTGNNRIAELNWTHIGGVLTSELKTYVDNIPNPYALDIGPNGTVYVASRSGGAIYKIDPDKTVTVLIKAPDIQWLGLTSKGDIAWASGTAKSLYLYEFATGQSKFINSIGPTSVAWLWCAIDVNGTVGPVDDVICDFSHTVPGTPVRLSLTGYKSIMSGGGPLVFGRVNFPGYGNAQLDAAGHYPWAVAISDTEAKFLTTGFGDQGIRQWRRLRATGEPAAFNYTAYNRGRTQWEQGGTYPSFATMHGYFGFNRLGLLNADDIMEMPLADQTNYIRSGADGVPIRAMTDDQIKDALYYLCMYSRRGILNGCVR